MTDSQGRAQAVVAAAASVSGCGRNGALVTFQVNGQPNFGSVAFVAGGRAAGAGVFLAVAAVVIVAATIAVIQGINVFTAAEIPGKLDAAVTAAQATPNLVDMISTDTGRRELYAYFLMTTMPDYPTTSGVPAQQATDRKFEIDPGPSARASALLEYQAWDGSLHAAYLSDGWFVDGTGSTKKLTLGIDYLDWDGKVWTASRIGEQFLHTHNGDTDVAPFKSDTIKYKDAIGTKRTAKLRPFDRTAPPASPVLSPAANAAGWHNAAVTVTWNWADNPGGDGLNGATYPTTSTLTGPGSPATVSAFCTDLAGNQGTASASATIDQLVPTISANVSAPPNGRGWHNTDVTVTFTCGDTHAAASGIATCSSPQTATDVAGNSTTKPIRVKLDKTAPTITLSSRTAASAGGWNNADVVVEWTCADSVSGVGDFGLPAGDRKVLSSDGANQSATGTCTDNAGNTSSNVQSGINIDKTAPALAACPTGAAAQFLLGSGGGSQAVSLTASDALSGLKATGNTLSGMVSTATVGSKSVTFSAEDNAGNRASRICTYAVVYRFGGFLQPVDPAPTLNGVRAGSSVPVRFSLGGIQGLAILAAGSPTSQAVPCAGGTAVDEIEQTVTAGGSSLSYDAATDQYSYVWRTERAWAGQCRQLTLTLVDGTTYSALFQFR